jgi:hypothetical protein
MNMTVFSRSERFQPGRRKNAGADGADRAKLRCCRLVHAARQERTAANAHGKLLPRTPPGTARTHYAL